MPEQSFPSSGLRRYNCQKRDCLHKQELTGTRINHLKINAMKAILIILILALLSPEGHANSSGEGFIVAEGMTYQILDMTTGFSHTRVMTTEGQVLKVPNNSVTAYRMNGHQYELLPLLTCQGDTLCQVFMEFISRRDGCRLYRYCSNCGKYDPLNWEIAPQNHIYRYYLLRNGHLKLLKSEAETNDTLAWFNIRVMSDFSRK